MKAVGYINSYQPNELDRETEIQIQAKQIREFCDKNCIELINLYEEPSCDEDYKPSLLNMINDASNDSFDKVIVLKMDRFGNDDLVKSWVIDELKKYSIEIHSLSEAIIMSYKPKPLLTDEEIARKVDEIKLKVKDIPSLPEVVSKIVELVQNPKSSARQISKLISHDPGLTLRVLKLVSSAYYGFPKQISSIQHAVTILGFTTIRGLVLSSSIFKMFTPKAGTFKVLDYKKFWKHSLLSAIAAKKIKSYLNVNDDEDIFSPAILHDIGKIILDQYDHENYVEALKKASKETNSDDILNIEKMFCGVNHCEIGHLVAEGWNLPESLTDILKYHHSPLSSKNHPTSASIVYLANILAHIILSKKIFNIDLFDQSVLTYIGLDENNLQEINLQIIEEVKNIGDLESFFN